MTAGNIHFRSFRTKVLVLSTCLLCSAYGRSTYVSVNLCRLPTCPFTNVLSRVEAYAKSCTNSTWRVTDVCSHCSFSNDWWVVELTDREGKQQLLKVTGDAINDCSSNIVYAVDKQYVVAPRVFWFPRRVASEVYWQMNDSCPGHGVVLGISFSCNDNKWVVKCTDGLYAEDPRKVWEKIEGFPNRKILSADVDVPVDVDL